MQSRGNEKRLLGLFHLHFGFLGHVLDVAGGHSIGCRWVAAFVGLPKPEGDGCREC